MRLDYPLQTRSRLGVNLLLVASMRSLFIPRAMSYDRSTLSFSYHDSHNNFGYFVPTHRDARKHCQIYREGLGA